MKTLFLEITEEGLSYRTETGAARLLQVGDTVTLLHPSGVNLRVELVGDYRDAAARRPSTSDGEPEPTPESLKPVPPAGVPF